MTIPTDSAERRTFFAHHVSLWERSGLSMSAYCRREAITYSPFVRWRERLAGAQSGHAIEPVRFIEATPRRESQSSLASGVTIEVGGDVRIIVPAMVAADLASFVVSLRSVPR